MIFQNFTYKQKIIGLLILSVILFLTAKKRSYIVAKNTYNQVKEVEKKLSYIENSQTGIQELQNEIEFYDLMIGAQDITPEEVQQGILNFSANFENVDVIGIEEIHKAQNNGFNIITNRLKAEGDFNSLLNFIYSFEKTFDGAIISSINFSKNNVFSRNNNNLRTIITFQNYDKIKF